MLVLSHNALLLEFLTDLKTFLFAKSLSYRDSAIIHILPTIVFFMLELAKSSLVTEVLVCSLWEMQKT